jgi:drug/metabolite transporter (DMT)-like permease
MGVNAVNHFRLLLALVMMSIIPFLFFKTSLPQLFSNPTSGHWLWFGLSGIVGLAIGDYFSFKVYVTLGPRLASVFSALAPAAALMSGMILVNEKISLVGLVGISITISGVIWLNISNSKKTSEEKKDIKKGIVYGICGAICQGLGLVLANKGYVSSTENFSYVNATWIRILTGTAALFFVTIVSGNLLKVAASVIQNKNNGIALTILGTIFGPVVGVTLSMLAVSLMSDRPSVTQTILSMVPIFVLPLNYIFNKEVPTLKSIVGALIAVGGVIVLIWRQEIETLLF